MDALGRSGAQIGGIEPPVLTAKLGLAAVLAAAVLAPRATLTRPRIAGLLSLLVALAFTWIFVRGQVETLGREFPRLSGVLESANRQTPVDLSLQELRGWYRLSQAVDRKGDYTLRLSGWLVAPETGQFGLTLECQGRCRVSLDGREILRTSNRSATEIVLPMGTHPLEIALEAGERPLLRLSWRRPSTLAVAPLDQATGARVTLEGFQELERSLLGRSVLLAVLGMSMAVLVLRILSGVASWRESLRLALKARWNEPVMRRAAVAGLLASLGISAMRVVASRSAPDGVHVHEWTGEYLMQTVSAADLRVEPFRSLYYNHIQPPALDALRAVSVWRHEAKDGLALLDAVDLDIYTAWATAAGLLAALVYVWLHKLAGRRIAAVATALFILHPAFIFYATFQDTTFVSGAGFTWISYEIWRLARERGSPGRLAFAMSLVFLTRSVMQWPFVFVAIASLWLLRIEPRRIARAVGPFALVVALFTLKQYVLFGVTTTSTFGPRSFCMGLSAYCHGTTKVPLPELPSLQTASALRRITKLNGEYNWNQLDFLKRSFSQMEEYKQVLKQTPPSTLILLIGHTATHWLKPSSRHSPHVLVDALPWREPLDFVMSGWRLIVLLLSATLFALFGPHQTASSRRQALGLALPTLYVLAITNLFESGENMRYKFFVEPVLWIFIWTQAAAALRALSTRGRARGTGAPDPA
jgi:hypothetical protein